MSGEKNQFKLSTDDFGFNERGEVVIRDRRIAEMLRQHEQVAAANATPGGPLGEQEPGKISVSVAVTIE